MAGYIILGTLAAIGCLGVLWAILGALLPGVGGWILVHYGDIGEEELWRPRWLKSLGLLDCPLLIVADGTAERAEVQTCSPEELISRLEQERNRDNGTGNGNSPGRHQRRGVSEL